MSASSSTTPSPERLDVIVNDFDERFVYRRNARNGGPYNARTLGQEAAQGDYVAHLDSDDEAFPWMLQQAVSYLDIAREWMPELCRYRG